MPLGARLAAAFAILATALLVVGLVGVGASRSLNLSSTSSAQGQRLEALALVSALGLNAQAGAHELVRHLYVYDGDLQNEDVIAWRVGQRKDQMLGELRQIKPQVADPRAVKGLDRLVGRHQRLRPRCATRPSRLSRAETVRQRQRGRGPQARRAPRTSATPRRRSSVSRRAARHSPASSRPRTGPPSPRPRPRPAAAERTIWIVIALALALSAVMAFVIMRSIMRPLAVLVQRLAQCQPQLPDPARHRPRGDRRGDLMVAAASGTEKIGRGATRSARASTVVDELVDGARASIAAYDNYAREPRDHDRPGLRIPPWASAPLRAVRYEL